MIKVKDSYGKIVRCFNTYKEASNYKFAYGNSNWQIIWEKKRKIWFFSERYRKNHNTP